MATSTIYSIIAQYDEDDPSQGDFCQAFEATSEAEAIDDCRVVMAENSGNPPGTANIVEIVPGINIWRAADLLKACKALLDSYAAITQRDPVTGLDVNGDVDSVITSAADAIAAAQSE